MFIVELNYKYRYKSIIGIIPTNHSYGQRRMWRMATCSLVLANYPYMNYQYMKFISYFLVKVSARVKKGEFLKFLISRCSDKAFQELSFKKNSTKKYSFSAKLLDVEVYYMLIVLITR